MSEVVERVARALYARNPYVDDEPVNGYFDAGRELSFEECSEAQPDYLKDLREDAVAVIEAMREPSDSMREEGSFVHRHHLFDITGEPVRARRHASMIWGAMIDAALSEGEGKDARDDG